MKWISVKDRLPEDFHFVLIYKKSETIDMGQFNIEKNHFELISSIPEIVGLNQVTHWMPLPKPPKK